MTRIAIVAASEELRTRLAAALATDPTLEVVAVAASPADVASSADIVLVARDVDEAVKNSTDDSSAVGPTGASLSNREREILALLADGLGNKQIAARLFISERTADSHVRSILNKLGFNSRAQVAAWMAASR